MATLTGPRAWRPARTRLRKPSVDVFGHKAQRPAFAANADEWNPARDYSLVDPRSGHCELARNLVRFQQFHCATDVEPRADITDGKMHHGGERDNLTLGTLVGRSSTTGVPRPAPDPRSYCVHRRGAQRRERQVTMHWDVQAAAPGHDY
jgi:hypothetical protein